MERIIKIILFWILLLILILGICYIVLFMGGFTDLDSPISQDGGAAGFSPPPAVPNNPEDVEWDDDLDRLPLEPGHTVQYSGLIIGKAVLKELAENPKKTAGLLAVILVILAVGVYYTRKFY